MGCASSTQVVTDEHTGQTKTKKKLGGAYPGQRRPQHQTYVPPADAFGKDGTATAHFIAYGGGNALTLVQQDGSHAPQVGKPQSEFIQVTLPDGVVAGQTIHVQAPDGRLNAILVPPGFGPGSTFTVEFAPAEEAPTMMPTPAPTSAASAYPTAVPAQSASPAYAPPPQTSSGSGGDDGFASGFGNPYSRPPPSAPLATAVSDPYGNSYAPAANAYPAPPQYPSK